MADYQKMYALLCGAIDEVLEPLQAISQARPFAHVLHAAMQEAESVYIDTTPYLAQGETENVIEFKLDRPYK